MNTLYVTDLDGTLLNSEQKTSDYTNRTINKLINSGMCFSYATARSYNTAKKATVGLTANFPVIVYNGVFIKDSQSGKMLLTNFFNREEVLKLIEHLISFDINPIVYSVIDGNEKFSYMKDRINTATKNFIATRKGDSRDNPVTQIDNLFCGDVFYITCIDEPKKLKPLYEKYKNVFRCLYQTDIYTDEQWFEVMPKNTSKANAVKQLAKLLDCDCIIAFGDGLNDIDLFKIADESYAVENAVPELKSIATDIIDSNNRNGVAKWLISHYYSN
ncbi:MAG: HAD family hydrolase [Ruminococcus sp.]|nr:HAD family hydrolase [Ruminococcus sp.]